MRSNSNVRRVKYVLPPKGSWGNIRLNSGLTTSSLGIEQSSHALPRPQLKCFRKLCYKLLFFDNLITLHKQDLNHFLLRFTVSGIRVNAKQGIESGVIQ